MRERERLLQSQVTILRQRVERTARTEALLSIQRCSPMCWKTRSTPCGSCRRAGIQCKGIHDPQVMFLVSDPYAGEVSFGEHGRPMAKSDGHGVGARSIEACCEKQGSFDLRGKSEALIRAAVRAVEIAIEEDEDAVIAHLQRLG